jgi:hypothetical protein
MMRTASLAIVAIVLAGFVSVPAYADSNTKTLKSTFEEQAFTAGCTSPVGLCATGEMKGGLHGPFEIVVTSSTPTSDPDVLLLATSSVVHTNKGDLFTSGLTLLNTVTGYFSSLDTVTGGTDEWTDASGTLQSTGTFDAATGVGVGDIQAVITTP